MKAWVIKKGKEYVDESGENYTQDINSAEIYFSYDKAEIELENGNSGERVVPVAIIVKENPHIFRRKK